MRWERSVVMSRGEEIGVEDLPHEVVHGEAISVKHRGDENDHGNWRTRFSRGQAEV